MQAKQRKSLKKYLEILRKRREYKKAQKHRLSKWQRFKKWSTVDRWIDLLVDIGLIAFDVIFTYTNSCTNSTVLYEQICE